jgi:2-polyprenyl-3-methyl-5-hydroxy-6-metoxy-1,4-benzoquinol methylase
VKCRLCGSSDLPLILDLGTAPPSNAYLTPMMLRRPEKYFPLRVRVCQSCWLVQAEAYSRAAELFNEEYAYFSSFSTAWLAHAEAYSREVISRLSLDASSHVIEVAANDGYLLQYFKAAGIPSLGIEPTASTAGAARQKGIEIAQDFLTVPLARQLVADGRSADLVVANNVLAHVPDLFDFVEACRILLKPDGVLTCEFPHLMNLVEQNQFDTVYHEHFHYLSLQLVVELFEKCGLRVFDVEELGTHGGSLRVWAVPSRSVRHATQPAVDSLLRRERAAGLQSLQYYSQMQSRAEQTKHELLRYLLDARALGLRVVGYGAAAKGNTLLNFAGVGRDLLSVVFDKSPHKQGCFLPGSRIPILNPTRLHASLPEAVLILPWNIRGEITIDLRAMGLAGTTTVCAVPQLSMSLL